MFKKLFILFMLCSSLFSEIRELTDENFEKATARNIVVVEFGQVGMRLIKSHYLKNGKILMLRYTG